MSQPEQDRGQREFLIDRYHGDQPQRLNDQVAVEEPLEIRIVFGPAEHRTSKSLSITMRTPGHDVELAAGFLLSENVVSHRSQFLSATHVGPPPFPGQHGNTLMVELAETVAFEPARLQRHFYMTSSCGICGKASLEAVRAQGWPRLETNLHVKPGLIQSLPRRLRRQQAVSGSVEMLVAVGAPSSLAVELAREFNLTLVGFASENRFNVYSASERISAGADPLPSAPPADPDSDVG